LGRKRIWKPSGVKNSAVLHAIQVRSTCCGEKAKNQVEKTVTLCLALLEFDVEKRLLLGFS
jgi:hypothetical protein